MPPLFSICIPAYNRSEFLPLLLDSIVRQSFDDIEVLIIEDCSPQQTMIRDIASQYTAGLPLRYLENVENLGYDGNLRELIKQARGSYCLFMGNDDILCENALAESARLLRKRNNIGVFLRAYGWFVDDPSRPQQVIRYFDTERFFSAGEDTVVAFFRRVGVLSGLIVRREDALKWDTEKFDGTLYYQMYLVANLLLDKHGIYTPKLMTMSRDTEPPDFGNANVENVFTPGQYTSEARLHMVASMLNIAEDVQRKRNVALLSKIRKDIGNYFYPYIRDQLNLPLGEYIKLYLAANKLGLWRYPLFHIHFINAYLLGKDRYDKFIQLIRDKCGRTPNLSGFSDGEELS